MNDLQQMSDQAIMARREYQKKWRDKNPDKVRAKNARYWERQAAKKQEAQKDEH